MEDPSLLIGRNENNFQQKSFEKCVKSSFSSYARQIFCALTVSAGLFILTFLIGSTSMLPEILKDQSTNVSLSIRDMNWLASGPILAGIPGSFLGYILCKCIGLKILHRCCVITGFFSYLLMAYIPTLITLYIGRLCLGVLMGILDTLIVPLIMQYTEPNKRGLIAAIPDIMTSASLLYTYLSFAVLDVKPAIYFNTIPLILLVFGSLFIPESPYWLTQKGRTQEALKSFSFLVGPSNSNVQELMMKGALLSVKSNENESLKSQINLLKEPQNWKPVLVMIIIFTLREIGGQAVIFYYALFIFQESHVQLDALTCTVMMGLIRLLSSLGGSLVHDRVGRRTMLCGSLLGVSILLGIGGLHLTIDFESYKWIPLASILSYTAFCGIGVGPVPWMLFGELVPNPVRFLGSGVILAVFYFVQFIEINTVPIIISSLSVGTCFLIFSIINIFSCAFIYKILPETRKKTLLELEDIFLSSYGIFIPKRPQTTDTAIYNKTNNFSKHSSEETFNCLTL